jgi:diguanylate cyclase (GGDEF)-like protein
MVRRKRPSNTAQAQAPKLAVALKENKGVKVRVEAAASELATTGTSLEKKLADGTAQQAAQVALKETKKVEDKVRGCAEDLHKVNAKMAQGVTALERTEHELALSQATLADTELALVAAQEGERDARLEALHDSATGLPNRDHFNSRLTHDIAVAARHGLELAVMFLDLDKFKRINDTHGHAAGDEVLKQVATRLLAHCRSEDTVCRTGGDEFLYVLIDPKGRQHIDRIVSSLLVNLAQPVRIGDTEIAVRSSIGIALYPEHGTCAPELIDHADKAMFGAKRNSGGPGWALYDAAATPLASSGDSPPLA